MRRRTHKLTINVTFDKPCTKAHALASVKDCIHGVFYPFQWDDTMPGEFRVRSFTNHKEKENGT